MALTLRGLNPFRAGRCLSTIMENFDLNDFLESQSLSSRAMSFDYYVYQNFIQQYYVSIPFDQGNVFRHLLCLVSTTQFVGLNPFRAGRCLSTEFLKASF